MTLRREDDIALKTRYKKNPCQQKFERKYLHMTQNKSAVTYWLSACCLMVVFMIVFGGFVRLTGSGLSIVEWKPVTGIIPPLSEADWVEEFGKYRASPEYKLHNYNMSLAEFKSIFVPEYIHRLAGRLLGALYLLPLLYFYLKGAFHRQERHLYLVIGALLFFQGFMGWYMVKSGLVDRPYVSHLRLAMHLITATVMYSLLFWQLMRWRFDILLTTEGTRLCTPKTLTAIALATTFTQIFVGGLVAGLDAGLLYNTFPLMGGKFVPDEVFPVSLAGLSEPVFVQFTHRIIAYFLTGIIVLLIIALARTGYRKLCKVALYLALALLFQMSAGIATILYSVPITIALTHQLGALLLLTILLWNMFLLCS